MASRLHAFDGWYGGAYDYAMSHRLARTAASRAIWGGRTAMADLDETITEAVRAIQPTRAGEPPELLDVPCGGGSLWPMLHRAGFEGRVIGIDLAEPMLARARRRTAELVASGAQIDAVATKGDALDLPIADSSMDSVISVNGLHCLPDPGQFLREVRRVLAPGASAWILTLVAPTTARERLAVRSATRLGVIPGAPPSRASITRLARAAGFTQIEDRGEPSLATFRLR